MNLKLRRYDKFIIRRMQTEIVHLLEIFLGIVKMTKLSNSVQLIICRIQKYSLTAYSHRLTSYSCPV